LNFAHTIVGCTSATARGIEAKPQSAPAMTFSAPDRAGKALDTFPTRAPDAPPAPSNGDDARNDRFAGREFDVFPQLPFVLVARLAASNE
jgi:hypothetical protein